VEKYRFCPGLLEDIGLHGPAPLDRTVGGFFDRFFLTALAGFAVYLSPVVDAAFKAWPAGWGGPLMVMETDVLGGREIESAYKIQVVNVQMLKPEVPILP
jgi:hypothetical protein